MNEQPKRALLTAEQQARHRRLWRWMLAGGFLAGVLVFDTVRLLTLKFGVQERWTAAMVQAVDGHGSRFIVLVFFIMAAGTLYVLRKVQLQTYAYLECATAVAGAWAVLGKMQGGIQFELVLALMSAGYLLVRGLSNLDEAEKKRLATPLPVP